MSSLCPFDDCGGNIHALKLSGGLNAFGCDQGDHTDSAIRYKLIDESEDRYTVWSDLESGCLRRCDPIYWIQQQVLKAREMPERKFEQERLDVPIESLPPYPTGFVGCGGGVLLDLRGMTTLSGKASSGKSWFALGSSLSAALDGWDVHYLAAEARDVIQRRIAMAYGMKPPRRFRLHRVEPGVTVDRMIDEIADWITSQRTLIVIDSISTLMELMAFSRGADKWDEQARLEMFLLRLRELTLGAVSILNLSEANVAGETKGRTLDHRSDVSINFKSVDDFEAKEIRVVKSWEGTIGFVGRAQVVPDGPGLELTLEASASGSNFGTGDF